MNNNRLRYTKKREKVEKKEVTRNHERKRGRKERLTWNVLATAVTVGEAAHLGVTLGRLGVWGGVWPRRGGPEGGGTQGRGTC